MMMAIMFFCQNDAGSCASPINVVLRKSFTCSWLISEPKALHWVMTLKTAARETTGTSTWRKLILMLPVLVHKYIANVCSSSRFACHICYIVPDSESRIQNYNNPLIFSAKSREPYCLNRNCGRISSVGRVHWEMRVLPLPCKW